MRTTFTASLLYTPTAEIQNPIVVVEDGVVTALCSRAESNASGEVVDFGDAVIVPGFFDIHIHGGAGVDVMNVAPSDLPRLNAFLAAHGVTAYLPTTVAAALDRTCQALERLAGAIEATEKKNENSEVAHARPVGIHLEGPFLSPQRRGVHPPEYLLPPNIETFDQLWQAARGHVRVMTIAPELPGALELIAEAARRHVCVSIGHSDAHLSAAEAAVNAGARHATHTFNAMRPLDHRDPGIIAEVLTDDRISADLIADGIHVAPAMVKLFAHMKGAQHAVLITDAIAATGMPNGQYQLGPLLVDVKDGKCTYEGKLAGSVLTMDRAVRNMVQFAGWSLRDAVRAATLNPAQTVELAKQRGIIRVGAAADFVVMTHDGEILKTVMGGRA
ncbi:MAG TPA: N-acetylglucosamine-6-phosphate deacetylase [Candidatus Sulfotelmatobacter sp.]|nr:N-acetylglucosamine-6-phosphate deacetylase [Candidatus Sulfotelmatobacter sp.]